MTLEPDGHDPVEVVPRRRAVVTALPLRRPARERLTELLDARVVDIRDADGEGFDVVLTPACSPQLIGALRHRFPDARVVVVELDDWEFDVDLPGPVKRILHSGADAYLLADSLDELAAKLGADPAADSGVDAPAVHELTASSSVDEVIAAFLRESVDYSVRARGDVGRGGHGAARRS